MMWKSEEWSLYILSHIKEADIYFRSLYLDDWSIWPSSYSVKQKKESLSAFHGHLSFLWLSDCKAEIKGKGRSDILPPNTESKAWSYLSVF